MRIRAVTSLVTLAALFATGTSLADDGYQPPNTLPWPLYRQDAPTEPRVTIGNAFGEYQQYNGEPPFLHSGTDIRGVEGDIVRVTAAGNIWVTVNFNDDACSDATNCRIYIKGSGGRYIYYHAHLALHADSEISTETRAKIIAASQWDAATGTYPVQAGTDITAGTTLARIGPFANAWPHLHYAIIDTTQNYDAINPLTALNRSYPNIDIIDDEPPVVSALDLVQDGMQTPLVIANQCTPIGGSVDLAATVKDSFYTTDPEPAPITGALSTFGIYAAEYRIRNVTTAATISGDWYRFDRAPLDCAGPDRGTACPVVANEATFGQHSFLQNNAGIEIGVPYAPLLFAQSLSSSPYWASEKSVLLLTNKWGQAGSWNTASSTDGWYQISAIARDADGNQHALSRFVAIDNHGGFVGPGDAFVRDNDVDVGAIPSTLGGQPFWRSPDIFILPHGDPAPGLDASPPHTLLVGGGSYDVYLRVHNQSCKSVDGIRAQIYSANQSMIVDDSLWTYVTPPTGEFVPPAGVSLAAGARTFLGPFQWNPSNAEATSNAGHRCMLAKIDATGDALASASAVKDSNNVAQKNLQFGETSFDYNNPDNQSQRMDSELRCNGFPLSAKGASVTLTVAYDAALYAAWKGAPGAVVTTSGNDMVVQFTRCNVKLPTATLPAHTKLPAKFKSVLGAGSTGTYAIDLSTSIGGVLRGGMTFTQ